MVVLSQGWPKAFRVPSRMETAKTASVISASTLKQHLFIFKWQSHLTVMVIMMGGHQVITVHTLHPMTIATLLVVAVTLIDQIVPGIMEPQV